MFFCVNGQLLQGYTMAPKERTTQDVADDLLGLLDDGDLILPAAESPKSPEKPTPAPQRVPISPKKLAAKKRAAPVR